MSALARRPYLSHVPTHSALWTHEGHLCGDVNEFAGYVVYRRMCLDQWLAPGCDLRTIRRDEVVYYRGDFPLCGLCGWAYEAYQTFGPTLPPWMDAAQVEKNL